MICPWCGKEMEPGSVEQTDYRFGLRWMPYKVEKKGPLIVTKGIKLTDALKGGALKMYRCADCGKFVVDEKDIEA